MQELPRFQTPTFGRTSLSQTQNLQQIVKRQKKHKKIETAT